MRGGKIWTAVAHARPMYNDTEDITMLAVLDRCHTCDLLSHVFVTLVYCAIKSRTRATKSRDKTAGVTSV